MDIIIRKARLGEITKLHFLINQECNLHKTVLPKSYWQLLNLWGNYQVAVCDGKISGCVGFKCWPGRWCEIISLVLAPEIRKKGIGTQLVGAVIADIQNGEYREVFCLAGEEAKNFFAKRGFRETQKRLFPEKIWSDCRVCPKNIGDPLKPKCQEEAMVYLPGP